MNKEQSLKIIGKLAQSERLEQGKDRKAFAALAGVNIRTLMDFEDGARLARPTNLAKLETVLRWRKGVVTEAIDKSEEEVSALTLTDMRDWAQFTTAGSSKPIRAEHLTDEELTAELTRRMRNYAVAIAARNDKAPAEESNVHPLRPSQGWQELTDEQGLVDLAADQMPKSAKERKEYFARLAEESQED